MSSGSTTTTIVGLSTVSLLAGPMLSLLPTFALAYSRDFRQVFVATLLGLLLIGGATQTSVYKNAARRIANVGEQQDDSFTSRGYDRIWQFPEYLLLGAGEGAYSRFRNWDDNEFHSTFGTIVFSYGFVGSAFFAWWMWQLYRVSGVRYFAPANTDYPDHAHSRRAILAYVAWRNRHRHTELVKRREKHKTSFATRH